ncbi:MAG: hypothetical protein IJJ44_00050 [Solobacterium sp.]|nr:hypothetical protein [Solobacterium sp.]
MSEYNPENVQKIRARIKEVLSKNAEDIENADRKQEEINGRIDRAEEVMHKATKTGDLETYKKAQKTHADGVQDLKVLSDYIKDLETRCLVEEDEKQSVFRILNEEIDKQNADAKEHIENTLTALEKYVDDYVGRLRQLGYLRNIWIKEIVRSEKHFDTFENKTRKSVLVEYYHRSMGSRIGDKIDY